MLSYKNVLIILNLKLIIYLFNLRPGVLIKTLSHKWGKLNLPTLLFKVGLLTLINMDSLIYLSIQTSTYSGIVITTSLPSLVLCNPNFI